MFSSMTVLHIYKIDSDETPVSKLEEGQHVIGRGDLMQCQDRRVSRFHAIITITQDAATITPTHVNPCFYKSASGAAIRVLTLHTPVKLGDGDKFALLANEFWYKIKLHTGTGPSSESNINGLNRSITDIGSKDSSIKSEMQEDVNDAPSCSNIHKIDTDKNNTFYSVLKLHAELDVPDEGPIKNNLLSVLGNLRSQAAHHVKSTEKENRKQLALAPVSLKREFMSDSDNDSPDKPIELKEQSNKILKASEHSLHEAKLRELFFSSDEEDTDATKIYYNNQGGKSVKAGVSSTGVSSTTYVNNLENKSDEADNQVPTCSSNEDGNEAGPSTGNNQKQFRDRCWYGLQCYRKKATHLKGYSHPGDSDYDSDPNDNRPMCTYGANCYRRNPDHCGEYKHPKKRQALPGAQNNATPQRKRQRKQHYTDSPEDDYDLDDPFIDDSGSEYDANVSEDDSDSDWSGVASEEDSKRLLKEAKHFTRKKKKD